MPKYLDMNGVATLWNQTKITFLEKGETASSATNDSAGNVISSTYVTNANAITGLSASGTTITITKGDSTTSTITTQDTTYSVATSSANGLMSAADKTKLDGITSGATKITVDSAVSTASTNPVQNKAVTIALNNKVDKVSGKGLSTNDYTTAEKNQLAAISSTYVTKANAITGLAVSGQNITITKGNGSTSSIIPPHYTSKLIVGASNSTVNAATSNGETYLRLFDDSTVRNSIKIAGSGSTSVASDANGNITISSTGGTGSGGITVVSSDEGISFKDAAGAEIFFIPVM